MPVAMQFSRVCRVARKTNIAGTARAQPVCMVGRIRAATGALGQLAEVDWCSSV